VRMPCRLFVLLIPALLVIGTSASAATPPPAPGAIGLYGPDGKPVHRPHGAGWFTCKGDIHANVANGAIVRNNGFQPMCIGSYSWDDKFTVYHSSVTRNWADFPNIYVGCEMDGSLPQLCTQGRATPVRVSSIRSEASSVTYHYPLSDFAGNAAYDIWFDRTERPPKGRDDGAEIMIWLGSNGIGSPAFSRAVKIDGIWWGYITWGAFHSGHGWNYIRYWRLSGRSSDAVTLNLIPFYKDAERAGRLSSHWYLTGTEFGFETCFGGKGLEVRRFTDQLVTR
jgi:hypothetical protein